MCNWNFKTDMSDEQVILKLPKYLAKYRPNNPHTVCIDKCIVDVILKLWEHQIITLGCCCGHGEERPSLVIGTDYEEHSYSKIKDIIKTVDERDWELLQWQLDKNKRYRLKEV